MRLFISLLIPIVGICAQAQPSFEVATVGPSQERVVPFQRTTIDTLTARNSSLREIIQRVYGIIPQQLEGPAWLSDVKVDFVGKAAHPATDSELWGMVRALLEDRQTAQV